MSKHSKVLKKLVEQDNRIADYEFDPGNDMGEHWLHLTHPFTCNGNASIHESTVAECLQELQHARIP